MEFFTIQWQDNAVIMLDQTKLPSEEVYRTYTQVNEVAQAIKDMVIRGAPAIGVAAALGMALAAQNSEAKSMDDFLKEMDGTAQLLKSQRPTAINLAWAVNRVLNFISQRKDQNLLALQNMVLEEALRILEEDFVMCLEMGKHGAELIQLGRTYLTHCNAGALATAGQGTALSGFYEAARQKKKFKVLATETRPFLQGARLTCWELQKNGIDVTLITDSMVGHLMAQNKIHGVFVGSDRIAANGDVANKIGTYGIAVLAKEHRVPFYVVAPSSSIDTNTATGNEIALEERAGTEITQVGTKGIAPKGIKTLHPAFDVTPYSLVTSIVTERGVVAPPFRLK